MWLSQWQAPLAALAMGMLLYLNLVAQKTRPQCDKAFAAQNTAASGVEPIRSTVRTVFKGGPVEPNPHWDGDQGWEAASKWIHVCLLVQASYLHLHLLLIPIRKSVLDLLYTGLYLLDRQCALNLVHNNPGKI